MRLRISLKLLFVIFLIGCVLTTLSLWTKCGGGRHDISFNSQAARVERWRHLQSSGHLRVSGKPPFDSQPQPPSATDASPSPGGPLLNEIVDEMMADFDSADLADNRGGSAANDVSPSYSKTTSLRSRDSEEIECRINDQYNVPCRKSGPEVYLPFYGFLRDYFEVYGKVAKLRDGRERFEWQHSYSRVFYPRDTYDPRASFLWFENYNVEIRERVKCISAIEGVPVSTQWNAKGHVYPIQVAQFGLSHFSKNLTEKPPTIVRLDNGYVTDKSKWTVARDDGTQIESNRDTPATIKREDGTVRFKTEGPTSELSITLTLEANLSELFLSLNYLFSSNSSVTCVLGESGKSTLYFLRYVTSDVLIESRYREVVYGIGSVNSDAFKTLTRDLRIDLLKGLALLHPKKKLSKFRDLSLLRVEFRGEGMVTNVTLSSSAHVANFFAASDWLVRNQDSKGGWPIMVTRKLSNGMLELKPGWYSAMAQGQAMSLLTRAFGVTKNLTYLESALKATKLFNTRSEHRGVMTTFLGKYVWYEEYPTTPSSFVLNGFVYSLIGLYDLKSSCTHLACKEASRLYQEGMTSLKKMLTLFDTGSGSIYDLRHFSLGIAPNLARWDYHTTHINQLLLLSTIDRDPLLSITAKRWIGYMNGTRAPHN